MPNIVKKMVVSELTKEVKEAEGMVLVSFGGLSVAETEDLRGSIASRDARFRMVRNNLTRMVLKEQGYEFPEGTLQGNTAMAYGSTEATLGAAKVLADPKLKKDGKVKFRAGILEGSILDGADAAALANIPDKDQLRGQLLGVISGPARALATVLQALPSSMARVIQAHVDQGESAD